MPFLSARSRAIVFVCNVYKITQPGICCTNFTVIGKNLLLLRHRHNARKKKEYYANDIFLPSYLKIIFNIKLYGEMSLFLDLICLFSLLFTQLICFCWDFFFLSSSHQRTFSLLHFLSAGVSFVKFLKRRVKTLHTLENVKDKIICYRLN